MQELLLIGNPAKRRRAKTARRKSRKAASPAQLRARARFAAMARGRTTPNPVHRRRARRTVARTHRRVRRNPIGGGTLRSLVPMLQNAAWGGAGALVNDVAYGYVQPYLPATFQTPVPGAGLSLGYYVGKGAVAIALGVLGRRIVGARAARMTEGALSVLAHSAMKDAAASAGINVPMGYMPGGRVVPALPISQNLRKYVPGNVTSLPRAGSQMGAYVSAAQREGMHR